MWSCFGRNIIDWNQYVKKYLHWILTDKSEYDLHKMDESGYNLLMNIVNVSLYNNMTCIYMYVLR